MAASRAVVGYKRWRLLPGVSAEQLSRFVSQRIAPAYAVLSDEVVLGLELREDGTLLAVQRWSSSADRAEAMSGPAFNAWWAAYEPVLEEWDRLVEFVEEWETNVWI